MFSSTVSLFKMTNNNIPNGMVEKHLPEDLSKRIIEAAGTSLDKLGGGTKSTYKLRIYYGEYESNNQFRQKNPERLEIEIYKKQFFGGYGLPKVRITYSEKKCIEIAEPDPMCLYGHLPDEKESKKYKEKLINLLKLKTLSNPDLDLTREKGITSNPEFVEGSMRVESNPMEEVT